MTKTSYQTVYLQPIIVGVLILTGVIITSYQFDNYQIQLVNQKKNNIQTIVEDTISTNQDQINQIASSLNQHYAEKQAIGNIDFDYLAKISLEQTPEIKNIFILDGNKIIQSYPHKEFLGADFDALFATSPRKIDGVRVLNPEFALTTQSNEKIIISVPVDFFVNPVIFSDDFKMMLFNPLDKTTRIYEIASRDGLIQTQGIVFSDSELRDSLTITMKTNLYGHFLRDYYVLRYLVWDIAFVKQTTVYEQILLVSGVITSIVIPILLARNQKMASKINNHASELQRANKRLMQVDRAKDEFAAMLSHELRTPLVPIQSYVDILLNEHLGSLNEEQKRRLQIIKESSSSLLRLVSDVLDAHKLELGQLKIVKNENNIRATVEKSISTMMPLASANRVEIKNHVTKDISSFYDEERIMQVITNLIKNGIKACQLENRQIEVSIEDSVNDIKLCVSDNGIGIPIEEKDKIFKKFYQMDTTSTRERGSGLGLAISKGIIETHGSKMWFESQEGKGTTFYFTIPKDGLREKLTSIASTEKVKI